MVKKGDVALRIVISKPKDRVDWTFLEKTMEKLGFTASWVKIIMMCITYVRYLVLVNDSVVDPIAPCRGLRQGFMLSPYLFILYAQGLSSLVDRVIRRRMFMGSRFVVERRVSHICTLFMDDSFFFFCATTSKCNKMKGIFLKLRQNRLSITISRVYF